MSCWVDYKLALVTDFAKDQMTVNTTGQLEQILENSQICSRLELLSSAMELETLLDAQISIAIEINGKSQERFSLIFF